MFFTKFCNKAHMKIVFIIFLMKLYISHDELSLILLLYIQLSSHRKCMTQNYYHKIVQNGFCHTSSSFSNMLGIPLLTGNFLPVSGQIRSPSTTSTCQQKCGCNYLKYKIWYYLHKTMCSWLKLYS